MNDDRPDESLPTLDYAAPRDDDGVGGAPRPGALLWVAAGLVWATSATLAAIWIAVAIGLVPREPTTALAALALTALALGVAGAERRALRGSRGANALICVLSIPVALLGGLVVLLGALGALLEGVAQPGTGIAAGELAAAEVVPAIIALAHARWARELREHAEHRAYAARHGSDAAALRSAAIAGRLG